MKMCNVILSTEPHGGKGGVATVIPMYLEALKMLGDTEFIPTHVGGGFVGKFIPWFISFFRCSLVANKNPNCRVIFHLHPGSGFCIIRMLCLAIYLRYVMRQYVFVYLHTPYLDQYLKSRFWREVIHGLAKCASRMIVLTSYAKDLLEENGLRGNFRVIPNPFRPKIGSPLKRSESVHRDEILIMGRMVTGKGFLETIRAFVHLPKSFRLIVAGEGPLKREVLEEIKALEIGDRVELKGWVCGVEKDLLLSSAAIFCLPSRVDSFGMSFIEAQCHDIPIVAFEHPPVMEVVQCDRARFVDSLDPKLLAAAILDANGLNSKIRNGEGRVWVSRQFGIDTVSEKLAEVINELLMKQRF